jgi:hypothetical protein
MGAVKAIASSLNGVENITMNFWGIQTSPIGSNPDMLLHQGSRLWS